MAVSSRILGRGLKWIQVLIWPWERIGTEIFAIASISFGCKTRKRSHIKLVFLVARNELYVTQTRRLREPYVTHTRRLRRTKCQCTIELKRRNAKPFGIAVLKCMIVISFVGLHKLRKRDCPRTDPCCCFLFLPRRKLKRCQTTVHFSAIISSSKTASLLCVDDRIRGIRNITKAAISITVPVM